MSRRRVSRYRQRIFAGEYRKSGQRFELARHCPSMDRLGELRDEYQLHGSLLILPGCEEPLAPLPDELIDEVQLVVNFAEETRQVPVRESGGAERRGYRESNQTPINYRKHCNLIRLSPYLEFKYPALTEHRERVGPTTPVVRGIWVKPLAW
jgi:hypothetical protein